MAQNGNNIYIANGNTIFAGTRANEVTVDGETIEIASATSGKWREYIAGRTGWSITVSFLVTLVKDWLPKVNSTYTLKIINRSSNADTMTGKAICTQCKLSFTRGNLAQGTLSFKGTGELA